MNNISREGEIAMTLMMKHFDKKFIDAQKQNLLTLKRELMNKIRENANSEELKVSTDELIEDGDQAQTYLNQNLSFELRERDLRRLREIDAALAKIEDGTYGICEDTEEPIGKKRLEKMPWTRLSIQAAEQEERERSQYGQRAS